MRAFVAVDVPATGSPASTDRATPAVGHLTLRFLGDLPTLSVPAVAEAMAGVAQEFEPFSITIEGIGAFPSSRDPTVVWRGIGDGRGLLIDLAAALDRRLVRAGIPLADRPFVPHLTWFRVRSDRERSLAREVLASGAGPPPLLVAVRVLALRESTLTHDGPIHRTIASAALGRPPRSG